MSTKGYIGLKLFILSLSICVIGAAWAGSDLDIARAALRDGLWDIARSHAEKEPTNDSALVVLESLANEDRWLEVLSKLDDTWLSRLDAAVFYRAAALYNIGDITNANLTATAYDFKGSPFENLAQVLKAEIALALNNPQAAIAELKDAKDVTSKMILAEALMTNKEQDKAKEIWQEIIATSNVPNAILALAAANIGEEQALRAVLSQKPEPKVRNYVTLKLGRKLILQKDTLEEGSKLILLVAKDSPDAFGAQDALVALAHRQLELGDYVTAALTFAQIAEIWPDALQNPEYRNGMGWTMLRLGRYERALEEFTKAEKLYTDKVKIAEVATKVGDVLSVLGKIDEAIVKYNEVSKLYPTTTSAKLIAEKLRLRALEMKGRDAFIGYRFGEAFQAFDEVMKSAPERAERMNFFKVLCLFGLGQDEEAENRAKEISETATDPVIRAEALSWLGKLSYNHRRWSEAKQRFVLAVYCLPSAPSAPSLLVWAAKAAFNGNDAAQTVKLIAQLVDTYPDSNERTVGLLVQAEALIELARFDEAVLVLEQLIAITELDSNHHLSAQILRADASFAMGADNPKRYNEALESYRKIVAGGVLTPSQKIELSYKIGKILEKLKRNDEAVDQYYSQVVLAYRQGRVDGVKYNEPARAAFARAAFHLADECEARGMNYQAIKLLELVATSDVQAANEASKRISRIKLKGGFQ